MEPKEEVQQTNTPATPPADNGGALTQDEVNALVGRTRKEARDKAIGGFLEELGFSDADELKAFFADAKKQREEAEQKRQAEMSELEKAQQEIQRYRNEVEQAKKQAQELEQARRIDKRNAQILTALKDAEHPGDVLLWIEANAKTELGEVMADDGSIDGKAVERLIAHVKKERPSYFKPTGPGTPSHSGGKVPEVDKDSIRQQFKIRPRL